MEFPPSLEFYIAQSDKESLYAFETIKDILNKRRSIISKILSPAVGVSFYLIILSSFFFLPNEILSYLMPNIWIKVCVVVLLLTIPLLSALFRTGAFSTLNLEMSYKSSNFLHRHKDNLIMGIINTLIGALLGAFFMWLFLK